MRVYLGAHFNALFWNAKPAASLAGEERNGRVSFSQECGNACRERYLRHPATFLLLAGLVLSAATAFAQNTLVSPDFKVAPDITLDSLALGASTSNYLAVWRNVSATPARIEGALVDTLGNVSATITLSGAASLPSLHRVQNFRVAFDGANFLVVWADTSPLGTGVHGILVSPLGVLKSADTLLAATTNTTGVDPQLVFTNDDYVLAWHDAPLSGSGTQLYCCRVSKALVAGTVRVVPAVPGHSTLQHLTLPITGAAGEALLVYQDNSESPFNTYAVRMLNTPLTDPGTFLFAQDTNDHPGVGAAVGGAYLSATGEYVILSSPGTQHDSRISRAWLHGDNTVALSTSPFATVGQGRTGFAEDTYPMTYFNAAGGSDGKGEFLFVRNGKLSPVVFHEFMKRVQLDSTDNDNKPTILDTASSGGMNGAVAASIGAQYFVAWMDGRNRIADPPFQTGVFGALIDDTDTGDISRPFYRIEPAMIPRVGSIITTVTANATTVVPMTVTYGFGYTTGLVDTVLWEFGDGSTATLSIGTYKYTTPGRYTAVYSIIKNGLYYSAPLSVFVVAKTTLADGTIQTVVIDGVGGGNGPPEALGGVPLPSSPGINPHVALDSLAVNVNFAKVHTDTVRLTGIFNTIDFPVYYVFRPITVTVGSNTYSFTVDGTGGFTSAATDQPFINFNVSPFSGIFILTVITDDLSASLAAAGALNATVTKQNIDLPVSVNFAGMSTSQVIHGLYTAKEGGAGHFIYSYGTGTTGTPGEGFLRILNATVKEKQTGKVGANGLKTGPKYDDFSILGLLALPNQPPITAAATGNWTITIGNYTQSIPVSSLKLANNVYQFKGVKVTHGISSFTIDQRTGEFPGGNQGIAFGWTRSRRPSRIVQQHRQRRHRAFIESRARQRNVPNRDLRPPAPQIAGRDEVVTAVTAVCGFQFFSFQGHLRTTRTGRSESGLPDFSSRRWRF